MANRGKIIEFDDGPWAEYVLGERRELVLVFGKGEFGVVMRVNSPGSANLSVMKSVAIQQFQLLP